MARINLYPEQEIARINQLKNRIERLRTLDHDALIHQPNIKSWSVVEVIKHMIIAHNAYQKKIDDALSQLRINTSDDSVTKDGTIDSVRTRMIPSMLIKRFPPKNGVIKSKMKTMKQFQPVFSRDERVKIDTQGLFDELDETLSNLKEWIEKYRKSNVQSIRFNSAVGAMVKFNVAEACELILCHNERHFQQIDNALAQF